MKRFNKIKKFILFFNIKALIFIILILLTLLITYLIAFNYKDLILKQFVFNKNRVLYDSDEKITPNIIILGNKYTNMKSLLHELNKKLNLAENKSDLFNISSVLKNEKLIKNFIITKTSYDLLTIKIEEKNIIGLTKINNIDYVIDEFNNLIETKMNSNLFHLPVFIGKNSNKNANVILRLIKESDIKLNYISFSLIDDRRWNINLKNGVKILLPESNLLNTLKLLKKIDLEYDILNGNFVEIDLRIYSKYFLKPKIN